MPNISQSSATMSYDDAMECAATRGNLEVVIMLCPTNHVDSSHEELTDILKQDNIVSFHVSN
jgi:hypothetical protein